MFPLVSTQRRRLMRVLFGFCALLGLSLVVLGVFAKNGWLPSTDPLTGERTAWSGREMRYDASGSSSTFAALPPPTPLPLSKEYIYAGSRLLAVEDANASTPPPADLAIWRPSTAVWWVMGGTGSQQIGAEWGLPCNPPTPPSNCDVPAPGDYDGDGKTDFSIFRPSTGIWWIVNSADISITSLPFGIGSDNPAQADFDGDGKTDIVVVRKNDPPGFSTWYIRKSSDSTWAGAPFGLPTDVPASGDYDGDGRADIGVWRNSNQTFYSLNSSNNQLQIIVIGHSGDKAVPADYDGDGKADHAVYDSLTATWFIRSSASSSVTVTPWGIGGDKEVPNDYDGDGKVDLATWRNSNGYWYIKKSSGGTREEHWGAPGDIPVPALYRR